MLSNGFDEGIYRVLNTTADRYEHVLLRSRFQWMQARGLADYLLAHSGFRSERYLVGLTVGTRRCTPNTTAPAVSSPTSAL